MKENNKNKIDKNLVIQRIINVSHWICKIIHDWKKINLILHKNIYFFKQKQFFQDYFNFSLQIEYYYSLLFCIKIRDYIELLKKIINFEEFSKFSDKKTKFLKKIKDLDSSKQTSFFSFPLHNYFYYENPKYEQNYWNNEKKLKSIILESNLEDVIEDFNIFFDEYINTPFSIERIQINRYSVTRNDAIFDFVQRIIMILKK